MKKLINGTVIGLCLLVAAANADAKGMGKNDVNKRGNYGMTTVATNASDQESNANGENGSTGFGRMGNVNLVKSDYVDANGDGVCDNRGARMSGAKDSRGKGNGAGNRGKHFRRGYKNGRGQLNRAGMERPNYVDSNNDGICDNFGGKTPNN